MPCKIRPILSKFCLLFLMAGLCPNNTSKAASSEKFQLQVGDSKELVVKEESELEVSRRGILDLFETKPGFWSVTAVRSGFVIVNVRGNEGNVEQRFFFSVSPQPKPDRTGHLSAFSDHLSAICSRGNLNCDLQKRSINGEVASSDALWEILSACAQSKPSCWLNLAYKEGVLESFSLNVGRYIGQSVNIHSSEQGQLTIELNCYSEQPTKIPEPPSSVSDALAALFGKDRLHIRCQNHGGETFAVRAQLKVVSKDQANHLGIDLARGVSGAVLAPVPLSREAMNAGEVIGEPVVVVRSGSLSKVRSGGEFKALFSSAKKNESRQMWKKYGMDLEIFLEKLGDKKLRIRTDLKLTSPLNTSYDLLANHEISSDTIMAIDRRYLIAMTELETRNNGHRSDFSFGSIPILGPIFRINARDHGKHVLMFWLEVRKELSDFEINLDQKI